MKNFLPISAASTFLAATAVVLSTSAFLPAHAASFSFNIKDSTDTKSPEVKFTLDDLNGSGQIKFTVDYVGNSINTIGDLRGVFFNIKDDSLLSGLKIGSVNDTTKLPTFITASKFGPAGTIDKVGNNSNSLTGRGLKFDAGLEIGQQGISGGDDFQTTSFILYHTSQDLTLEQFSQQNFGARIMSVGSGNNRGGSNKLTGQAPLYTPPPPKPKKVPEPATTAALGLFLAGALGVAKKKSLAQSSIAIS
ncbi:MAG: PEP-CTERM sorting domain-containing protein [Goleter apudmare HA4340-LM2]|jgi:hypothetical protein|nr:PEP-CTERM sorting domain-containing protein [Goleter apudmare HA4340-LM2]